MIAAGSQHDCSMLYNLTHRQRTKPRTMNNTDKPARIRAYKFPADKSRGQDLCSAPAADMCARLIEYGLTPEVILDTEGAMEYITIPEAEATMLEFLKRMSPRKFVIIPWEYLCQT
jgi:hypothetical protein